MGKRIIECVPNYSEGRDMNIIRQITNAIESVNGVKLLNVDPGNATNRTVVTFVGDPDDVVEAAFRGSAKAAALIDMRKHHGTHPRIGATDVLPLIPVTGITLEECATLARGLAERMANKLDIPCYCYEAAAFKPERKNLAVCRSGEYEALAEKLNTPERRPDYMPTSMGNGSYASIPESILRSGCSVVGARNFLIAVNYNLNTTSTQPAKDIASEVREKGGGLKCVKAIGWYIEEYGIAQVSMNMTDFNVTPLHVAYEEVCRCAEKRGLKVTGTEIIGMVPKKVLTDASRYFLDKHCNNEQVTELELVKVAIKEMGLDDLKPFNPNEKVIEYKLETL